MKRPQTGQEIRLAQTYEGMFLLDNQVVREDWKKAKSVVTDLLKKHGGKVACARRWDERRLAYTIRRHRRATYCLAHYEIAPEGIIPLIPHLELHQSALRYLLPATEAVPPRGLAPGSAGEAAG